jgi:hypothetical protein
MEYDLAEAHRNDGKVAPISRPSMTTTRPVARLAILDFSMVTAAPVLQTGYVVNARRIANRRIILAGYRWGDLLTRVTQNFH